MLKNIQEYFINLSENDIQFIQYGSNSKLYLDNHCNCQDLTYCSVVLLHKTYYDKLNK
jgi:hypothetical protein